MANPTTNFGWVMPTSTDLVTDLPADFAVFGQAVDTSMADLKGGTTGQILAKATNTDMDFTWITNDQGDITAVNTTAPLAGGGTSGALTLSIAAATTSVVGAVQLSDSTSTTSSVLAATPTAVKSAYDLANGAIPKTLIDAAGDLIVGTAADTAGRLAIGTAGQVLKVNSGATALEWGAGGGASGPAFSVFRATTSQSFTAGVNTKVQWNGETFDTDNCFDSTTNYRFTPTTAGYYQINCSIYFDNATADYTLVSLDRNGVQYRRFFSDSVGASGASAGGSAIVYLNGSSDYLEIYVESNATSPKVYFNAYNSYFDGVWIRS
jgi:hypothetical protein